MALSISEASSLTSIVVGLIALLMAGLAWRARVRSGNRRLAFVAAAFALFFARSLFSAYNVLTHFIAHDFIELYLSIFDLAILVLLFLPFLLPKA